MTLAAARFYNGWNGLPGACGSVCAAFAELPQKTWRVALCGLSGVWGGGEVAVYTHPSDR
jgi:hypothetical protein